MPRREVFSFKRCLWRIRRKGLAMDLPPCDRIYSLTELFDVNAPIAATFEHPAQIEDCGEYGMSVPTSRQMANLGPGIRVEQIMPRRPDTGITQQPPIVDEISAHEADVGQTFRLTTTEAGRNQGRGAVRLTAILRSNPSTQTDRRLIDADHIVPRKKRGQHQTALARAATGV